MDRFFTRIYVIAMESGKKVVGERMGDHTLLMDRIMGTILH